MSDTWTIGELAERAADALRGHAQPVNGRVREVPGARLIRWYTTIGLVDPPLTRRGRIARYGRRHLLQLVAVKRLQAQGMSIARIQVALAGATDAALEATAGLPGHRTAAPAPRSPKIGDPGTSLHTGTDRLPVADGGTPYDSGTHSPDIPDHGPPHGPGTDSPNIPEPAAPCGPATHASDPGTPQVSGVTRAGVRSGLKTGRRREGTVPPAPPPDLRDGAAPENLGDGQVKGNPGDGEATGRERFWADRAAQEAGRPVQEPVQEKVPGAVHGVRLADGAVLVLDGTGRAPGEDDVRAVLEAAAPLLAVLEQRGLT